MVQVSRRAVLAAGVGTAAVLALGVDADPADAATVAVPVRAHFATSVGKVFTVTLGGHSHRVTLTAIRNVAPTRAKDRPTCFTLIFTPARGVRLHDGIYRVQRKGVPTHSLFLSTVGTAHAMQAVVNRPAR